METRYKILDFKGEFNNFPELYTVDELLEFLTDRHIIKEIQTEKLWYWKGTECELEVVTVGGPVGEFYDYYIYERCGYSCKIDHLTFNACLKAGLIEEREVRYERPI